MGDDNSGAAGANLPPGFRFYPSDEELVVHFLHRKTAVLPCRPDAIPDLGLFPHDPWDLDGKALSEGGTWYYYSRMTTTHARESSSGQWCPTGVDEPIYSTSNGRKVGMKKHYMFCMGDPSSDDGAWTNWVMHEYRLPDSSSASTSTCVRRSRSKSRSRWVICKVYEQSEDDDGDNNELSCLDEVFLSMDDYDEISLPS